MKQCRIVMASTDSETVGLHICHDGSACHALFACCRGVGHRSPGEVVLRCLPSAQSRHIYALVRYNFSCADSRLTRADGGRTICLQCVLYNSWPTTLTLSRYLPTPTSPAYFFQPGCEIFTASRALKPHKAPRFIHRPLSHFPARSSLCRSRVLSGLPPNLFLSLI